MAAVLQLRIRGRREQFLLLRRIAKKVTPEAKKMTKRMAEEIGGIARGLVGPKRTGIGKLKKSIRVKPLRRIGYTVIAGEGIASAYPYFQEKGFAAHTVSISAIDPSVRERWRTFGHKFDVSVHTPYMRPAYNKVAAKIDTFARRFFQRVVRR